MIIKVGITVIDNERKYFNYQGGQLRFLKKKLISDIQIVRIRYIYKWVVRKKGLC